MISVVIPWREVGCPHRLAAMRYVLEQLDAWAPTWEVVVATDPTPDRFIKGEAVRVGVAQAHGDIVVMHDGDLVTFPALLRAVAAVEDGAPWSMPMTEVRRLTPASTEAVLAGISPTHMALLEKPYRYVHEAGGCMVAPRETLVEVPIDRRYTGYGAEDESHGMALTVLKGPAVRIDGPAYHLWHPPQARPSRYQLSPANNKIRALYAAAWRRQSPAMFRQLLDDSDALTGPTDLL